MSNLATALNLAQLFDVDDLIISTARYYTGRTTALASTFAMQLAHAWPQLSGVVQAQIKRDLERAFQQDDYARGLRLCEGGPVTSSQLDIASAPLPLGHDMDRQAWEAVRRAWGAGLAPAQPQPPARSGPRPQLDLFPKRPLEAEEHSPF